MSKARKAGLLVVVVALALVITTGVRYAWFSQLYGHWHNQWYGNQAPDKNIWLPDYKAVIQAKPVVLTCAMRPASALNPDGPQNLMDAVAVALTSGARGVVVVCAGVVHGALEVQKAHTYQLNAFSSGDAGPLAFFEEGLLRLLKN